MPHQILNIEPKAIEKKPANWPNDDATRYLLADLENREKIIGQPFHLEPLTPSKHHVALCVGITDRDVVFCIPPQSGRSPALYLWAPLVQVVACNGLFKWASPRLSIAKNIWPLVPPLKVGVQYFFKQSEHSEKILAEDQFDIDTMVKCYMARFAGIKLPKPLPTEIEAPTLRPLQPKPGRSKVEVDSTAPGLCP